MKLKEKEEANLIHIKRCFYQKINQFTGTRILAEERKNPGTIIIWL
jgi:hypothetical protein